MKEARNSATRSSVRGWPRKRKKKKMGDKKKGNKGFDLLCYMELNSSPSIPYIAMIILSFVCVCVLLC